MSERVRMIVEELNGVAGSKVGLAARYGVSRKTLYKWLKRFEAGSWDDLKDRSRAPRRHPNALPSEMVARILELKRRYPFLGAPKLRQKLRAEYGERTPAESSLSAILKRQGLSRPPRRRCGATPSSQPLAHAAKPNDVWTVDLKGDFSLGDGVRCYPLTVCDAYSRYFLGIEAYGHHPRTQHLQEAFTVIFREYGLPAAIRSDNGTPFATAGLAGLSQLSVWWVRLGIRLERIEPGQPQQNGRHERAHRTLKEQTARPPAANLIAQQQAFARFAREFNWERPHEALDQQTPSTFYEPSTRPFPERIPEPLGYPRDWVRRRVSPCGRTKWQGVLVPITKALTGQHVGFKPVGDGLWEVYFEHLLLGTFDERRKSIKPVTRLHDPAPFQEDYAI